MSRHAPEKAFREGISLLELMEIFPTEAAATEWFETIYWPDGRHCGHCDGVRTRATRSGKPMPYWCTDCRNYFSVRTGTAMATSNIPLRKWAMGIYLCLTNSKSASSMKLHRDLKIGQKAAWFMLHRLREAWATFDDGTLTNGPVEVDETFVGGKRRNMSNSKREQLTGRGPIVETAVIGAKDRATNSVTAEAIESTDHDTLEQFVIDHAESAAIAYTDCAPAYNNIPFEHETVKHSVSEFVRDKAHTNRIESFRSMLKRAHEGTFHKISPKHLNRYVQESAGRHNIRKLDTLAQMASVASKLSGKRLKYDQLIADNGFASGAHA